MARGAQWNKKEMAENRVARNDDNNHNVRIFNHNPAFISSIHGSLDTMEMFLFFVIIL